jgi:hypothetical protein
MSNLDRASQNIVDAQVDMFRLAKRDYGLSAARLAALSDQSVSTVTSWANGTAMPVHGLVRLMPFIADELLTLVTESAGKRVEAIEIEADEWMGVASEAAGFVAAVCEAKRDGIITPSEDAGLKDMARRLAAKASAQ